MIQRRRKYYATEATFVAALKAFLCGVLPALITVTASIITLSLFCIVYWSADSIDYCIVKPRRLWNVAVAGLASQCCDFRCVILSSCTFVAYALQHVHSIGRSLPVNLMSFVVKYEKLVLMNVYQ